MLRLFRLVSVRELLHAWPRTLLVVGGIATGTALMTAIAVINATVLANFRSSLERSAGPAALEVTLGFGEVGFDEAALAIVRADSDVVAAVPLVRGTIALADDPADALMLVGTDLASEEDLRRYRELAATDESGVAGAVGDRHGLLLGAEFAARHGLRSGDRASFVTPGGVELFTVRSLLAAEGTAAAVGGRLAVMDIGPAQQLLDTTGRIDQIDVMLRDGADPVVVRDRLTSALPPVLRVARPAQRGEAYDAVLGSFQSMLTAVSFLCLVAGAYLIYNTTSTAALQRGWAIATLRVFGAESPRLLGLLLLEAVVLGLAGTAVGIPYGIGLARLLVGHVATSMGVIFQLRFPVDVLTLPLARQAAIAAIGITTSVAASFLAARRLARVAPLDVLRGERRVLDGDGSRGRALAWCALLVGSSVAALVGEVRFQSAALGNVSALLWYLAIVVVSVPLVQLLAPRTAALLRSWFGTAGAFAGESLVRAPVRTGVTIAAIALVLTVGLTFASLTVSCEQSIASYYTGGHLTADLQVSALTTQGGWLETPLSDGIGSELAALPGVRTVDTIRIMPGHAYRGERIALAGCSDDVSTPERLSAAWYREGRPDDAHAALVAGTGALISIALSDRFGLHVGDALDLESPSGTVAVTVAGIIRDYVSDRGTVMVSTRLLAERWHDRSANRFFVHLRPDTDVATMRRRIADHFGARVPLKVLSMREVVDDHARHVRRAFALMESIQLLMVIVAVAGVFDLLLSSAVERRREVALWQLIGADPTMVRRAVVVESATIGTAAALLGGSVGCLTAWLWIRYNFRYLVGYALEFHLDGTRAAWLMALTLLATLVAGGCAAGWALRQPLVSRLRAD